MLFFIVSGELAPLQVWAQQLGEEMIPTGGHTSREEEQLGSLKADDIGTVPACPLSALLFSLYTVPICSSPKQLDGLLNS